MSKVIVDEKKIDEALGRGVENVYPDKETLKKKLMSGERIRLYCGYDPTAPSLHVGHAITIKKLADFQKLGHEVVFLLGSFTAMIGDPDKKTTRNQLTREKVLENAKDYQKQASPFLDFDGENPALVKFNHEWNDKLSFREIIELASHFTVQQMIQRDMFQKRLEEGAPIRLHEFFYPLIQGYDSVAMDVDLEVGGNDQMFNMMFGRDLVKDKTGKEKCVLTTKILADDTGKKMGKTEGNALFLSETSENMYGIVMSWPDGFIAPTFDLLTDVPTDEIERMREDMKNEKVNPRDLKMSLAKEVVRIFHGEEASEKAEEHFVSTVQKKELPEDIEEKKIDSDKVNIVDLLVETNFTSSKGESRRVIAGNGVKIDGEVVKSADQEVDIKNDGVLLQKGKRNFLRIVKK